MMIRLFVSFFLLLLSIFSYSQPYFSHPHGLFEKTPFDVSILSDYKNRDIRFTLDGSEPTTNSFLYEKPLHIKSTTILRAVEVYDGVIVSPISTVSYIFVDSILNQSNHPSGYPEFWGKYSQIDGQAVADYEMNPQMTRDELIQSQIIKGFYSLPILSIVSEKDYLFSHNNDPDNGGIYIYTGSPYGDQTGRGWTRLVNIELFGGVQNHNLNTTCGIRIHGGAGRMAEYNPKHSFRLVFKNIYGPNKLDYPIFGDNNPSSFDQLVLRCHFDNSWQHLYDTHRPRAQYARDVWVRMMQRKMGHLSVNALYVHLFINGLYWGLYNIAERVDEQFVLNHLGGAKKSIDIIEVEEIGGLHMEASEGKLDGWNNLVQIAKDADDSDKYQEIERILDIDSFIDYIILNQYAGNTDWDRHNWYAVRSQNSNDPRFKLICWDSECVFHNKEDNVVDISYGDSVPTGLFLNLMKNCVFSNRYMKRADELLSENGLLGYSSVIQVWDSLYNDVSMAVYDEAARWGDYRNKVHPYKTQGEDYTVDKHFMLERERLINDYFPSRSQFVLATIKETFENTTTISDIYRRRNTNDKFFDLKGHVIMNPSTERIYIYNGKKHFSIKPLHQKNN